MRDIKVDAFGGFDLLFASGDFVIADSAQEQSLNLLFATRQGDWKRTPAVGIGYDDSYGGNIDRMMDRNIRVQLESDGFKLEKMTITEKGLTVNGRYI